MTTTTTKQPSENAPWYALPAQDVTARMGVDPDDGLAAGEAERRLGEYGPNELPCSRCSCCSASSSSSSPW
jgi:P-type Ca2+ transporter type 2C